MKLFASILTSLLLISLAANSQDGLVAHWSFDEISGDTIIDHSQYGNHGTNYGAESVQGIKGNALSFDGVDDYVRIPENWEAPPEVFADLGKGAISVWFKADHIPTDYGIAPILFYGAEEQCDFFDAANQGLIIELGHSPIHYGSERLYFTIWKNGCTYPSFCYDSRDPVSTGEWHHFVAVVGEDYNTGYLDGVEMTDRRYNFGNEFFSQFFEDAVKHEKLWLGRGYWDRTTQYFEGAIDELRIYDKPLNTSEVLELYNDTTSTSVFQYNSHSEPVKIYPSPTSEKLYFEMSDNENQVHNIIITDARGKEIFRDENVSDPRKISVENFPDGWYLIHFSTAEQTIVKKFVVSK